MSTTNTPAVPQSNNSEASGNFATEKVTYRSYVKLNDKGEIDSINAKAEAANQASWKKLEASGATLWNTNEFIRYIVHSDDGFKMIVPDEAQRLYIIQAGLNYVQNSKANAYMVEPTGAEGADASSPKYNNETIDLKDAINDPPSKRALTDQQKLERLVKSMGLSGDEMQTMFAELAKRFAAQATPALTAETEVTEEAVS